MTLLSASRGGLGGEGCVLDCLFYDGRICREVKCNTIDRTSLFPEAKPCQSMILQTLMLPCWRAWRTVREAPCGKCLPTC